MMKRIGAAARHFAAGLLVGGAPSLYAQEGAMVIEEIVVTATKRSEQALFDVPLSIQAFSTDALEAAGIRDQAEVIAYVPGASEEQSSNVGSRQYQIRGIAQGSGDPSVGYYLDDAAIFFFGQRFAPMGRAFDMERIEVLRGPQSTLYGNGSMGGTVRYIPKAPSLSAVEAEVVGGYADTEGGEGGYYVDGMVSVPVVEDRLGFRVAASYEDVGGYQDSLSEGGTIDDVNDADVTDVRASVLYTPTDRFELKLMYARNEANQDGSTLLATLDPPINIGQPGDFSDISWDIYSGTVVYDFGAALLTTTTSYIEYSSEARQGLPFPVPGGVLLFSTKQDAEALNNETRLVSQTDGPFQWLVGVFYSDTEDTQDLFFSPPIIPRTVQDRNSESISVFGEVSWDLLDGTLIRCSDCATSRTNAIRRVQRSAFSRMTRHSTP